MSLVVKNPPANGDIKRPGFKKGVLVTKETKADTELYACMSAGAVFSFLFYNNNIYYYCILFLYHLACADLSSPTVD